ncbi:3-oxoacyl-[acyl-carrier protein] reductase [Caldalkalibacillus uzonensis]|uniref:3-oxoacyl-[acyl-carrier protein] reductase n=1 Tax=Caldalkalibacillus uzonensis TaxID=353224 RepID=A0ABU0CQM3_9BACI|nr:glucose 1-dehydrogenase [Caldalkalibacillus uzonensis]MDQ0338706.1 3-oxoacyl-[acyl-carrier protein] reductase [Caldalkalibacillus uzonensis]
MRLEGKTMIVAGAGGGMGLKIVEFFLREGAQVAALDLNTDPLKQVFNDMDESRLIIAKVDVTSETAVTQAVQKVHNQWGKVNGLVHAAGIAQPATPVEEVSKEEWHRIIDVNVTSAFLLSKAVVPYMKQQQQGVIIPIASISSQRPRPGLNAYIASKGALVALAQALAIELAPFNIRVNALNPGPADTQMLGQFTAAGADVEETKESIYRQSVPLGRLIKPEDIAHAAVYLCSDEAQIVTGAILNVDGGRGL